MKTIQAHDKAIILILTKPEALAMSKRLEKHCGIAETKTLLKAKEKLSAQLGKI